MAVTKINEPKTFPYGTYETSDMNARINVVPESDVQESMPRPTEVVIGLFDSVSPWGEGTQFFKKQDLIDFRDLLTDLIEKMD